MIRKTPAVLVFYSLIMVSSVFAQDDIRSIVDYKVNKMQKELKLTDAQVYAVKPIIKDFLVKRHAILQEAQGEGIVDHVAVKGTLKKLRDEEHLLLSKVLDRDQMDKMINKENLMLAMNPDSAESEEDDGVSMDGNGVDLKF